MSSFALTPTGEPVSLRVGLSNNPDQKSEAALADGGAAVLPWGVGKWLGVRAKVVQSVAESWLRKQSSRFFLGDPAHRCWHGPTPRPFGGPGVCVLAGSDVLPLPETERRRARYRFRVEGQLDESRPAASLLEILSSGKPPETEGSREPIWSVLWEQLRYLTR